MSRKNTNLETLTALQDRQLVSVDTRTLFSNGNGSLHGTVPKAIADARGLDAGDVVEVLYDQERDEIVIPLSGGDSDDD